MVTLNLDSPDYKNAYNSSKRRTSFALRDPEKKKPIPPKPVREEIGNDNKWAGLLHGRADAIKKHAEKPTTRIPKKRKKKPKTIAVIPPKIKFDGFTPEDLKKRGRSHGLRMTARQLNKNVPADKIKIPLPDNTPVEFVEGVEIGKAEKLQTVVVKQPKQARVVSVTPSPEPDEISKDRQSGRNDGYRLTMRRLKKGEAPDDIKLRIPAGASKDYRLGLKEGRESAIDEHIKNQTAKIAVVSDKPKVAELVTNQLPYDVESTRYKENFAETKAKFLGLFRTGAALPSDCEMPPMEAGHKTNAWWGTCNGLDAAKAEYELERRARMKTLTLAFGTLEYEPESQEFKDSKAFAEQAALEMLNNGELPEPADYSHDVSNNEYCGHYLGVTEIVAKWQAQRQADEAEASKSYDVNSPDYEKHFTRAFNFALGKFRADVPYDKLVIKDIEDTVKRQAVLDAIDAAKQAHIEELARNDSLEEYHRRINGERELAFNRASQKAI